MADTTNPNIVGKIEPVKYSDKEEKIFDSVVIASQWFLAGWLCFGATAVIGILVLLIKGRNNKNSAFKPSMSYLYRTFFFGMLWGVIGVLTYSLAGVGVTVLITNSLWVTFRALHTLTMLYELNPKEGWWKEGQENKQKVDIEWPNSLPIVGMSLLIGASFYTGWFSTVLTLIASVYYFRLNTRSLKTSKKSDEIYNYNVLIKAYTYMFTVSLAGAILFIGNFARGLDVMQSLISRTLINIDNIHYMPTLSYHDANNYIFMFMFVAGVIGIGKVKMKRFKGFDMIDSKADLIKPDGA